MRKVVLTVAAGALALGSAIVPAGAAAKKATETVVLTNGVAAVHAVSNEGLNFGGPGKAILKKKVDGNWVTKHSEAITFKDNTAYWEGKVLAKSGKCKVVAKYLGNKNYAASASKGYPIDCKSGMYNGT